MGRRRVMKVKVSMLTADVRVPVNMNIGTSPERAPEGRKAKSDDHQGHTEFKPAGYNLGNRDT